MRRTTLKSLIVATGFLALPLLYQNCSAQHDPGSATASQSQTPVGCGEMKSLFERTYHQFTKTNCNTCHTSGGVGKGAFADADLEVAWGAFQIVGFSKVSEFAVNPSHNPPYTGEHNEAKISELKQTWIAGLEEQQRCENGDKVLGPDQIGDRLLTTEKTLGLSNVGDSKVISWNLSEELVDAGVAVPNLGAGTVEVKVEVVEILGQIAYYISEPWVRGADKDLHVEGLRTMINGSYVSGETTFAFIKKDVYANSDTVLSAGTSVVLGLNNVKDTIALSFGIIEPTTLPPPYLGPKVTFSKQEETVIGEKGMVSVNVNLNEEPQETVVVTIRALADSTAKARRSERTDNAPYDFFDWDFTLGTVQDPQLLETLTFTKGGPLTQSVQILISNDMRDEPDEEAIFEITAIENGQLGAVSKFFVRIPDNDVPPENPFVPTFSQLMTDNGVLKLRCLECHNTVKKEGGYDLTDYETMISSEKSILVPGAPSSSEMFIRIGLEGPGRMPLDQSLSPLEQSQVEEWILNGAKNN